MFAGTFVRLYQLHISPKRWKYPAFSPSRLEPNQPGGKEERDSSYPATKIGRRVRMPVTSSTIQRKTSGAVRRALRCIIRNDFKRVYSRSIFMIRISSSGLSMSSVLTFSIIVQTSIPLTTRPNTVCLLSSQLVGTVVIKNCKKKRKEIETQCITSRCTTKHSLVDHEPANRSCWDRRWPWRR